MDDKKISTKIKTKLSLNQALVLSISLVAAASMILSIVLAFLVGMKEINNIKNSLTENELLMQIKKLNERN